MENNLKNIIKHNFSLYANSYDQYSIIQKKIAIELINILNKNLNNKTIKSILDLGCGSGIIYEQILKQTNWHLNKFTAIDLSLSMCELHKQKTTHNSYVEILNLDFDEISLQTLGQYDLIVSSSSLQWSKDLKKILNQIKKMSQNIALNIFTNNTFKSIWKIIGNNSPILSKETILDNIKQTLPSSKIEILNYNLKFNNKKELFKYIKKSGVGTTKKKLNFTDSKKLLREYPTNYLEFEIIRVIHLK